jgi:hypothetical protein
VLRGCCSRKGIAFRPIETRGRDARASAWRSNERGSSPDEFDGDIVYGTPPAEVHGGAAHQVVTILPLGTETITPLCAPSLAPRIRSARDVFADTDRERQ